MKSEFNPLEYVEELAENHQWGVYYLDRDELLIECPGSWRDYDTIMQWSPKMKCLCISTVIQTHISKKLKNKLYQMLGMINEQVILGHFLLIAEEDLVFRYTLPVQEGAEHTLATLDDIISLAVEECDRFYPAFQFLLFGKKNPNQSIASALLETEGEA